MAKRNLPLREVIEAYGHENIRATHRSTLEITKDPSVTPRGDCIIAVSSSKACADLSPEFKKALRTGARVRIEVRCGEHSAIIRASGSPLLTLSDARSIVIRKSDFIDGRTLAIGADKAAADLPRDLVSCLRRGEKVHITIYVE